MPLGTKLRDFSLHIHVRHAQIIIFVNVYVIQSTLRHLWSVRYGGAHALPRRPLSTT
jgi:hypothetical protein